MPLGAFRLNSFKPQIQSVYVPTSGIVADELLIHLDADNTNSYSGSGNTWFDLTGNGFDGTINGAVYNTNGWFDFNTSNVDMPPANNTLTSINTYTCGIWFKISQASLDGLAIIWSHFNQDGFGDTAGIWELNSLIDGTIRFYPNNQGAGNGDTISFSTPSADTWYYMTAVKQGTSASLYINGNLINTNTNVAGGVSGGVNRLGQANQAIRRLNGSIAEVELYNKALNSTEVQQNYDALKSRFGY